LKGEFEPSYRYLVSLLGSRAGEEEATRAIRETICSAGLLQKQSSCEISNFLCICEEIRGKELERE
jgi:hypothetical protein